MARAAHARAILLLVAVTLLTALPFVRRAYFVDDHYFLTIARHLAVHPDRPYDFRADDELPQTVGWESGHPPRMVNPLLFHYYLAAVIRIFGGATWVLRSSALLFSVVAVLAMYFIGFRLTPRPLYAALLFAVTPAFWLTSYSLLIDGAMIGFFLAALWTFMAGLERRHRGLVLCSGLLMGATMLTKYSGALVVILAFAWQAMHPAFRRWRFGYAAYAVAALGVGAWCAWTAHLYGATHLLASAARGVKADEPIVFYLYKLLVVGSFLGGGSLFMVGMPGLLWARSRASLGALAALFMGLLAVFTSAHGGFTLAQGAQLAFWFCVAAAFGMGLCIFGWPGERPRQFLTMWFCLAALELIVVMPWTAGRYLLVILPPAIWLMDGWMRAAGWGTARRATLALTAVGSFLIASADAAQANVLFDLSQRLAGKNCISQDCYYLGDTFSAYPAYLSAYGWRAAFPSQTYKAGDVILVARYRQSSWWRLPDTLKRKLIGTVDYPFALPIRVMDVPDGAGWYASCWGPLPFVIANGPLERFDVFEVVSSAPESASRSVGSRRGKRTS